MVIDTQRNNPEIAKTEDEEKVYCDCGNKLVTLQEKREGICEDCR